MGLALVSVPECGCWNPSQGAPSPFAARIHLVSTNGSHRTCLISIVEALTEDEDTQISLYADILGEGLCF